ncbi:MAG: TonB-dependent receptor [Tenuifilaceae bacterium]|jgi:TonB-linked SusC/RagA family outer membrane protein|nr:TonB-dependent receptor [Tenuifilaceae bacterium]
MKRKIVFLGLFVFLGLQLALAQTRQITGTVISAEYGDPMPGISVIVKGTTIGTATDGDGRYTVNVPQNANTLVFSFVGMRTQEIEITSNVIDVAMEFDVTELDEIVVVAYGTATRESLTGSVAAVNASAIEKRPVSSVGSVLEGFSAGVQVNNSYGEPGSDPSIRIRGFTTINGSNAPLYVIDGVPFGGNISDLNPQDIESLSVLKDAASSALYGNRASNGVIMITTKKGKSDKLSLRATVNQGVYNRGIREYERLNADEFMETMWLGYRNSLMSDPNMAYSLADANAQASSDLVSTYLGYNIYNKPNNELFDSNGKLVSDAQILAGYDDLDWFKYMERLGHRQEYSVSADAATENSNYFFSLGYLDEQGYVRSSDYERLTARTNVTVTPKKWMKAGLNISGSHQVSNNTNGSADSHTTYANPFFFARNIAPIYPVYLHDQTTGEYIYDEQGEKIYNSGDGRPQYNGRHVIWESELDMDRTFRNTMQSMAFLDINFLEDFTFSVKGDMNLRNSENQSYNNAIIGDGSGSGRAKRVFYRYKNYTFQQQLTWKKKFDRHSVDALLAHENYNYNYAYTYGYKTTEVFAGGTELVNFTDITSLTGYQHNYRTESYLSRIRYNYDSKYYFDASFRRDGSSRFYEENRWGNFWSTGATWIITREDFMANLRRQVNMLKLRASYGEVGNDNVNSYYAYMALYTMAQNANLGASYKIQNDALDLIWETSSSFGTALEGRLFDRLDITLEYFDKRSQNLLFDVNLPLSAGATSTSAAEATLTKNIGSIANRGVEFALDIDVVRSKDWNWKVGLNATSYKNTIIRLPEENRENGIISGTKRYMEGHGIYDFWMDQFVGVDQMTGMSLYIPDFERFYVGEEAVEDKNPIPSEYTVQIGDEYYTTYTTYAKKDWSGSAIPDVFGSISSALNYKGFTLSALFTYSIGGKIYDNTYRNLMSVTATPAALHKNLLNSWNGIPEGMSEDSPNRIDPNGTPRIDFYESSLTNASSSRFLHDASYFVIKNVSLSYELPKSMLNKIDVSGLTINFGVENLATFTKLQGMNPQQSFNGINNNAFLTARVFSLGANLRF